MYKLFNGDCLEVLAQIPDGSVDAVICDPPYGTTSCKWDAIVPLEGMWAALRRVCKPKGVIVLTASQPFTTTLISSNIRGFKYCWTWEKSNATGFANAKMQPLRVIEDVVVFYEALGTYNPQDLINLANPRVRTKKTGGIMGRTGFKDGYRQTVTGYPKNILKIPSERGVHPTQKPIPLMEYLIKTYTNESETVLDFTMGSGTTGVAAMNTGRKFIGIELDKGYFDIAKARIDTAELIKYAESLLDTAK